MSDEAPMIVPEAEILGPQYVERAEFDAVVQRIERVEIAVRSLPEVHRQLSELRATIEDGVKTELHRLRIEISSLNASVRRVCVGVAALAERTDPCRSCARDAARLRPAKRSAGKPARRKG